MCNHPICHLPFAIIEQISMARMIAFAPAVHKVGSRQFGRFSLDVGLWLGLTEVLLMKFPVDLFAS